MSYGFREVIVDQPFAGKWTDVDMNLGGHGTFQGTKLSDRAGGFSYKALPSPKQIMQNRFIYWRVLNDMLEMTETSMDRNLEDNQVRIIFRDSPIVSPISIHETEDSVIILVVTVSSINRFVFAHPNKLFSENVHRLKHKLPSIFQQAMSKPLMNFRNFSLFEHGINVPVPIAASSHILPQNMGYIFALSYESGSVTVYKLSKDDTLILYDLRQANLFAKILSFTPLARTAVPSNEAVIALQFFTARIEPKTKTILYLVALTLNGHIRLYMCNNLNTLNDWSVNSDQLVDKRFADGSTECNMLLRTQYNTEGSKETPKFFVFLPGEGLKFFITRKEINPLKLVLVNIENIDFREKSVMDFTATTEFLFILVSNPDEETDWELKSYNLKDTSNPRFNLALLEPPARSDVTLNSPNTEPQDFFCDLIFNKSSFSSSTIYNAISMFPNSTNFKKYENDWDKTKEYALNVLDSEIRASASGSDEPLSDEEIFEINSKQYEEFYKSCVEYHVNTVKPLGIFYETNTRLVCIVKKSRISFLRPTDTLETMFYFPHCISQPDPPEPEDNEAAERGALVKFLEIIELIECTTEESHRFKVEKRIKENRESCMTVWNELANLLTEADPHSEILERRHFIPMLTNKLRELGPGGESAMRLAINCLCNWEVDGDANNSLNAAPENCDDVAMDDRGAVSESYMGSRLGANTTYGILKQLLNHRYMIARNTLILQSIVAQYFTQNNFNENVQMVTSFSDQRKAQSTFLRCYAVLKFFERNGEPIKDSWVENGLKVAHLLNCSTADHLDHGKLTDNWPIKLIELFCHSSVGGLAIRSRVNPITNSMVVAYADAAGRALWPNDGNLERPFEEFLIAACQYNALSHYAESKIANSQLEVCPEAESDKSILRRFYSGVADFFIRTPQLALGRFLTITPQQLEEAPYFYHKILGLPVVGSSPGPSNSSASCSKKYYEKVISLFQIFGFTNGVQQIAEKALAVSNEDHLILTVLGFKNALSNGDYKGAYNFIARMPDSSVLSDGEETVGKEKESSIRAFVVQILEAGDIELLINLRTDDRFYNGTTIRDEIEKVLNAQAKLSDPLTEESVYQMVYFYHLGRRNFSKAASAMLDRITQIGFKGHGRSALEIQRDSYLDILACMSLYEEEPKADRNGDPEDWLKMLRNAKISNDPEEDSGVESRVEEYLDHQFSDKAMIKAGWAKITGEEAVTRCCVGMNAWKRVEIEAELPKRPVLTIEEENLVKLQSYQRILKECELCISLLMIPDDRDEEPLKCKEEKNRAETAVLNLTMIHQYDQAIKLARLWELPYVPIVRAFAMTCVGLLYDIPPASGDPADYVRHLDVSDLPNTNSSVADIAFLALERFVAELEKPIETYIHKEVTLVLLTYQVALPRWLLKSYKKRDAAELLRLYVRFGDWEDAANLSVDMIDATLGRRDVEEFDPSVQTMTPHIPFVVLPKNYIEWVANKLMNLVEEKPEFVECFQALTERIEAFVIREEETQAERKLLYGNPSTYFDLNN